MKKILVTFSVLLLMGFAFDIQAADFSEWAVGDTIGPKGESAQFSAVDYEGKLWITDYGTPGTAGLYIFNSDGSQASFSPITEGLDEDGNSFTIANPGGVAYYDSIIYAISDNPGAILKFKASDGTPLNGWTVSYRTGDIDVDTTGHVFVCHKVEAMFSVYDTDGNELGGSPFGAAGWHLNRGISVTQDGSKVFLADESSDVIAMYTGSISGTVADYTQGADFMTGLSDPSACEIDPNGRMWISNSGDNELIITELDGTILQTITDVATPRGAAFDFDNNLAYVIHFTSAANMAHQLQEIEPVVHPEPQQLYTWGEKNVEDYTFFQADDKTRGMDLNDATGNMLVASRTGGDSIHIIDNGEHIGTLDMTDVSGGVFAINLVSVADDGVIYGSNLTTDGSGFKVYKWESELAAPTVAFEGDVDQRVGDSFTAVGSGAGTILYASGVNATKIYVFTTVDGQSFTLFDEIPISASQARGGIAPAADTLGSDLWINKSGGNVVLIDTSGTVLVTIGDTLNTYFAHVDYLETSDERKLIAVAGGNVGDIPRCIRAEIWDVTNPSDPWYYEYGALTNTPNANGNGTGIAVLRERPDGILELFHLLTNNGIAYYSEEPIPNTPPAAFHIIAPPDLTVITSFDDPNIDKIEVGTDSIYALKMNWTEAIDPDEGDTVTYQVMISPEGPEEELITRDTCIYIPLESEQPWSMNGSYEGYVIAKDLIGAETSSDTITITFDLPVLPEIIYADIVLVGGAPKLYAMFSVDFETAGIDNFTIIDQDDETTSAPTAVEILDSKAVMISGTLSEDHFIALAYSGIVAPGETVSVSDTVYAGKVLIPFSDSHPEDAYSVITDFETDVGAFLDPNYSGSTVGTNADATVFEVSDEVAYRGTKSGKMTIVDDSGVTGGWYVRDLYGFPWTYSVNKNSTIMFLVKGTNADVEMRLSVKDTDGYEQGPWTRISLSGDDWQIVSFDLENDIAEGWITGNGVVEGETVLIEGIHIRCPEDKDVILYIDEFINRPNVLEAISEGPVLPEKFALHQNYPNPFNPTTFIKYDLPKEAVVRIVIYDLMGREVRALVNEKQNAGYKSILWDGKDNNGQNVASGIYIYHMTAGDYRKSLKMTIVK